MTNYEPPKITELGSVADVTMAKLQFKTKFDGFYTSDGSDIIPGNVPPGSPGQNLAS